jgi:colanic acid biosynthesis glycosyl transferase WcaI
VRITFFNRFFFPDTSATSQILSDLAFHLAARGHDVRVVTTAPADGALGTESIRGVEVHRVAKAVHAPGALLGRAISYLAFHAGARAAARRLIKPGDVAVIKTDPPMLGASIGPIARRRGARVVNWLQDVFPEVAQRYGVPGITGPVAKMLRDARNRSLAAADRNVVVGERMARHLADAVGKKTSIDVIHNWSDGALITPLERERNPLRNEWDLGGRFVVGYSGNLGRVHEFATLLEAARLLRGDASITFLIVGRGPRLVEVRRRVARMNLDNVKFRPHQARDRLPQSLCAPDVHLAALAPEYEGLVVPSKLYGVMAAGRPTVFIGDPQGEAAAILAQAGCGLTVRPGDAEGLVDALQSLRTDPERLGRMGAAARSAFEARYDFPVAMARWEEVLSSVSK